MEQNKQIYLPQFAGKPNPYDKLWQISIEVGQFLMFKTYRSGIGKSFKGENESLDSLLKRHSDLLESLESLTEEEKSFLFQDSLFKRKTDFLRTQNSHLMEMLKQSPEYFGDDFVTKDFLVATLGEEAGNIEYERRCRLCSIARKYTKEFLSDCIHYLIGEKELNDGIAKFLENFDTEPDPNDVLFMLRLHAINFKLYSE